MSSVITLFQEPAVSIAPNILGYTLCYDTPDGGSLTARIIETEAYPEGDPSTYKFMGKSLGQSAYFSPPGTVYMHFSHGKYSCLNISCLETGRGESVLIRAVEPLTGLETMWFNRYGEAMPAEPDHKHLHNLTSGPGKLIQAFGLTKEHTGIMLSDHSGLSVMPAARPRNIVQTTRVGLTQGADLPWRWYDADSRFVSKR